MNIRIKITESVDARDARLADKKLARVKTSELIGATLDKAVALNHLEPVNTFTVQFNRNTFNPASRAVWLHAYTGDTLEAARAYLTATRAKFKHVFGYPSDVKYRIIKGTK